MQHYLLHSFKIPSATCVTLKLSLKIENSEGIQIRKSYFLSTQPLSPRGRTRAAALSPKGPIPSKLLRVI